ncbi:MAG: 6-carboxytetrahydropterin synthase QueD [Smithella sp.]|nr:6-carboxytetrahydropterin synthase QueD [Smithella sp.]MDM7987486.1 6-carboxytetrahydropterin synthase QueD [Smithella sp.]HOU51728.1 6-carboxytetrahydropterin synthase QueD [Smithella sp.]HQG66483.1 6-carboxytetrahydropterin synthase QueD [Smithella sp.]HQH15498.1 6-carboxytetrahydropterin synthase QueD [Smithella sp.]
MEIFKVFKFDAAHRLPCVGTQHKCSEIHGHSFRIEIHISGPVDPRFGWVIDFADIHQAVEPLLEQLDHKYLNDVEGLNNPTSENIARWIWERLCIPLPQLSKIVVQESPESGCIYQGEK